MTKKIEVYKSELTGYHYDVFEYCGKTVAECVESGVQHADVNKEQFTKNLTKVSKQRPI